MVKCFNTNIRVLEMYLHIVIIIEFWIKNYYYICILFVLKPLCTCGTRICPTYRSLICHLLATPTHSDTTI